MKLINSSCWLVKYNGADRFVAYKACSQSITRYLRHIYVITDRRFACPLMYPHVRLTILTVDRPHGYILLRCHRKSRGLSLSLQTRRPRLPTCAPPTTVTRILSFRCKIARCRLWKNEFNVELEFSNSNDEAEEKDQ